MADFGHPFYEKDKQVYNFSDDGSDCKKEDVKKIRDNFFHGLANFILNLQDNSARKDYGQFISDDSFDTLKELISILWKKKATRILVS